MKERYLCFLLVLVIVISGCAEKPITGMEWFQIGNTQDITKLNPKKSIELEDNHIGTHTSHLWHIDYDPELFPDPIIDAWKETQHIDPSHIFGMGIKRIRLAINDADSNRIDWDKPELSVDPNHDEFITALADNGLTITYMLSFWNKALGEEKMSYPRFKTEEDIQAYLDFVKFIVNHFKDRIHYYEIWNEPNIADMPQWIEVEDYIKLVKRTIPVIKAEHPEAKVVVGSTSSLIDTDSQEYLFKILESDIMPLVDVVEWHPLYGQSPEYEDERQYYYEYPSMIQKIKDTASAHGFTGEYVADEIHWCTLDQVESGWHAYTETKSAKYYARGIIMHLGEDVAVSQIMLRDKPKIYQTVQNLCTVMAGAKPSDLPVEIQSEAENIRSYSFSLTNGDKLITLWTDGVAVDDNPGVKANIIFEGLTAQEVIGIDMLNGYTQPIIINGNVIQNLIVRDYPLILRFS